MTDIDIAENLFNDLNRFIEKKSKEHKCKPSDLNIGYSEGESFLYKTYRNKYGEIKISWEQNLITGEIIHGE